jgi:hypothetical protein
MSLSDEPLYRTITNSMSLRRLFGLTFRFSLLNVNRASLTILCVGQVVKSSTVTTGIFSSREDLARVVHPVGRAAQPRSSVFLNLSILGTLRILLKLSPLPILSFRCLHCHLVSQTQQTFRIQPETAVPSSTAWSLSLSREHTAVMPMN